MDKYYMTKQPPISDKFTFLVDDISQKCNYGLATDIEKINYNRKLIGDNFNIDVKVGLLMTEGIGGTFVFDLGSFIVVLELKTDEKEGKMAFYDHVLDITKEELNFNLLERYSQNVVKEWLLVYDKLNVHTNIVNDIVQLHKPEF